MHVHDVGFALMYRMLEDILATDSEGHQCGRVTIQAQNHELCAF